MATIAVLFATVLALYGFQAVQSDAVIDSRPHNSQTVLVSNSYDGVSNVILGANPNSYQNERIVLTNPGYGSDNIGLNNYNLNSGLNLVQTDSYGNNVVTNGLANGQLVGDRLVNGQLVGDRLVNGQLVGDRLVNGRTLIVNGQPLLSGSAMLVNGQRAVLYGETILLDGQPVTLSGQTVVVNGQTIPNAIISNGQIITSAPTTVSLVNGYENNRLNPTPVVYIADPCLATFEPSITLTSCCSRTAGLIPGLVGTRCCIAQGSKCSIHPNGCCAGTVCTSIGNPVAGIRICDTPNPSYTLGNNNGYGTTVLSSSSYSAGAKK